MVRRVIAKGHAVKTTSLHAVMTPGPDTISPEQPLCRALEAMQDRGYRHLPVVDKNRLVGLVSIRDIPLNYRLMRDKWESRFDRKD
jgi:CBS domain-containing protein